MSTFSFMRYLRLRIAEKGILNIANALGRRFIPGWQAQWPSEWARFRKARQTSFVVKVVQIETIAGCNYRCSFCPIGKISMPLGRMEKETFDRIIEQLRDYTGYIHLFMRSEPLLDKRLVDFARQAATGTRARVVVQTNGSLLTEKTAQALSEYATVIVNDYTAQHSVLRHISQWPHNVSNKLILVPRSDDEVLSNRAGNVPNRPVKHLPLFCVRPFEQLYIAFNGDVVLCCQDWKLEHRMGNVLNSSLEAIWTGPQYELVRNQLLRRNRVGLCAKCDFTGV